MITRRTLVTSAVAAGVGVAVSGSSAATAAARGHRPGRRGKILIRGGRVLTEQGELDAGDVLVHDDVIEKIAPRIHVQGNVEVIDASGMIVGPGYVDNHKHLWESLVRGVSANFNGVQHRDVVLDPLPDKLTVDDMYVGTLAGALDALANGSTTVVNWDLGGLTLEHAKAAISALDDAGIRAQHSFSATRTTQNDPNSAPSEDDIRYLDELTRPKPLLGLHLGSRNPVNRGDAVLQRVIDDFALARELGLTISLHCGQPTSVATPGVLNDHGLLGPDVLFVNGSAFTDAAMNLIAQHGGWIITAPESELQAANPPPLASILAAGIKPTVCTDSYAFNPSSMPAQVRILLQSARERDIRTGDAMMTMEEAYAFGTINPAMSLNMSDRVGSLAPGKQADIILVDTSKDLTTLATTDVYVDLLQMSHPGHVDTVLVAGKVVKRRGELLGHNLSKLRRQVHKIQERLL